MKFYIVGVFLILMGCVPMKSNSDAGRFSYVLSFLDAPSVDIYIDGNPVASKKDNVARYLNVDDRISPNLKSVGIRILISPNADIGGYYAYGLARVYEDGHSQILFEDRVRLPIKTAYDKTSEVDLVR